MSQQNMRDNLAGLGEQDEDCSSDYEYDTSKWLPEFQYKKPAKYTTNNPMVIYLPPAGIPYVSRQGQYVRGVAVYNQETAHDALQKIFDDIRLYLHDGNPFSGPFNLEKLFRLNELGKPVFSKIDEAINLRANK